MKMVISFASNTSGGGFYHITKTIQSLSSYGFEGLHIIVPLSYTQKIGLPYLQVQNPNRSYKARMQIRDYIKENRIDLFYTVAGPINLRLNIPHIVGLSNAWLYSWNQTQLWKFLNITGVLSILIGLRNIRRADGFVFQSEFSKKQFIRHFGINEKDCHVVPNAMMLSNETKLTQINSSRILVPMSIYPHKGFMDISFAAENLNNMSFDLTCSPVGDRNFSGLRFIGGYQPEDELKLFSKYQSIVLPSYLETISGWMLAAVNLEMDVIVRDTDFNRAFFIDESVTYYDTPEALVSILKNSNRAKKRAQAKYPLISYQERVQLIMDIIKSYNG